MTTHTPMATLLLSHNHAVPLKQAPALSPEDFTELFRSLEAQGWEVVHLGHPHWISKVSHPDQDAASMGQAVAEALRSQRRTHGCLVDYAVLALGGRKDGSGSSGSPLEPGCWGVDVVETPNGRVFLDSIGWTALSAARPSDGVFSVVLEPGD